MNWSDIKPEPGELQRNIEASCESMKANNPTGARQWYLQQLQRHCDINILEMIKE